MTPPASRSWDSRQKIFQPCTKIFAAAGPAGRPAADGAGGRGEGGGRRGERGRDGDREEAPGGDGWTCGDDGWRRSGATHLHQQV